MKATWRERIARTLKEGAIYFGILAALVHFVPDRMDHPTYSIFRTVAIAIAVFGGLLLVTLSMSLGRTRERAGPPVHRSRDGHRHNR